jgi:TolB-like protein/DNA-binding winged helix-turn-helix (wHTH) protein/Tfp pilus assembly protein PilF
MDAPIQPDIFLFGNFRLDQRGGGLFRRGEDDGDVQVTIGSRALDVLTVLVRRHGELVTKDEIMTAVWPDTVVEEANLVVQISSLRRVLDAGDSGGRAIQTVSGRGYRFVLPVTQPSVTASEAELQITLQDLSTLSLVAKIAELTRPGFVMAAAIVLISVVTAAGWTAMRLGGAHWFLNDMGRARLSIVVLPFTNLNNDPEQGYFVDAITDDLTTDLSRIAGSVVIAHSTAQTYRDRPVDVRQLGRELDVRYVLEGSVQRMEDQVEVNAQLVDTSSAIYVWADRFKTDRRDMAEAQNEIIGRLARTLNLELLAAADQSIEQEKNQNPDAEDLIMRGWNTWFQPFSAERNRAAEKAFERALEIDPRSIDAKIGIATVAVVNSGAMLNYFPAQERARAERLLVEVTERDPHSSRAHEVLGMLRRIQNRLEESLVEYKTAVALDQNNANAFLGLGETLTYFGLPAEAIPSIERAVRLNPHDPNIAFDDSALGICHLLLGHVDRAIDLLRRARTGNPRVFFFRLYLAGALGLRGDLEEARTTLTEAIRLKPEINSLGRWTAAQPWLGNPALMALRDKTLDAGLRRAGLPDQ